MNKDNAKDYLPFVRALADGKELQVYRYGKWSEPRTSVGFDMPPSCYRIKREPVERWGVMKAGGDFFSTFASEGKAKEYAERTGGRYFLMREVV